MFEFIGRPKCVKRSVSIRLDQERWITSLAGKGATFSAALQAVVDCAMAANKVEDTK